MSDSPHPSIAAARSGFVSRSWRERLPWPPDRPFRVLSIDGGGIRGIYPAAVLSLCEREFLGDRSVADYFDLIVGTSTGGILALGLSVGRTAAEILEVYREDGRSIFPPGLFKHYLRNMRSLARYRYDRGALTRTLTTVFGNRILAEARTRLCIPAFEGHHGEVYIFKTPHHPDYRLDGHMPMTTVGLATSAAPTYFEALDSGGYRYVDGGVWANNPAMIGLVDALACFQVEPRQVRMLSLGCGNEPTTVSSGQAVGGLFAWRGALFAAMNLQSQNALGQVGLLIGPPNLIRVGPRLKSPIAMDDWSGSMSLLPDEAASTVNDIGPAIAKTFFEETADVPTFYWPPVEPNHSKVTV